MYKQIISGRVAKRATLPPSVRAWITKKLMKWYGLEDVHYATLSSHPHSPHRRLDGAIPGIYWPKVDESWKGVRSIVSMPTNLRFAVGYGDGAIRYYDAASGFFLREMKDRHAGGVSKLVAAPGHETIYSGGTDGIVKVFDGPSGDCLYELYQATGGAIISMVIVPGGNLLYTGAQDGIIRKWNLGTRQIECQIDAEGGRVFDMAINPGKIAQLVVAYEDGVARVFEMR
eukprot:TRINITY_DN98591_c0_g1_i1.p1 TRINITY_DN98591_c0_g1~~TRINITY_DN98591_c0_g1_i1.p1  ORF type:complete len:240 (-),score=45.91 TRINITY_DN98591_c0_g1_i1:42-728(-)